MESTPPEEIGITNEQIRESLNVFVRDTLPMVAFGLGGIYILIGIVHAFILPESVVMPLSIAVGIAVAILFGLGTYFLRSEVPPRHANNYILFVILMLSAFSNLRMGLAPEIPNALSQPLILLGAACVLLSRRYMAFLAIFVNVAWCAVALAVKAEIEWREVATPMLGGTMLAVFIHAIRLRFFGQLGTIMLNEAIIRQQLEKANRDAEEARELAEAANLAKSTFIANMSHELRTPLNSIMGYSEMLQVLVKKKGGADYAISDLERIHSSGGHLLELINEILDLSKIEAGRMELHLESFDPRAVLEDVVSAIRPLTEKNSNELSLEIGGELDVMHTDLTRLRQILFNLLSNASKFTKNGTIRLEVTQQKVGGETWAVFEVKDSGIGMTEEQAGRIFDSFAQADTSTTRKYGGTGLGLTISRKFSQMMGGDIEVHSAPDEGSTFTVRLPVRIDEAKPVPEDSGAMAPKTPQPAPRVKDPARSVLVIDDEANGRDLITRILNAEGLEVVTASGGEEGLRLARELRPSAITLDVMMPHMDGWAVLSRLKSDPDLAHIPVIMLTMVDEKNLGESMGASEFLTKPIRRDALVGAVKKYRKVSSA